LPAERGIEVDHVTIFRWVQRFECDHGRLKARLRPMRGLKRDRSAQVIISGHALMQNIRRGHHELGIDARAHRRVEYAFTELAHTI
jgi:IS6 family transposase